MRDVLRTQSGLEWLDEENEWFWFSDGARNRLMNIIRKVMAVTEPLGLLSDCVRMHTKSDNT